MSDKKLHKHTLNLRTGDWEKLREMYPDIKTSKVVQHLVSAHIDKQMKAEIDTTEDLE